VSFVIVRATPRSVQRRGTFESGSSPTFSRARTKPANRLRYPLHCHWCTRTGRVSHCRVCHCFHFPLRPFNDISILPIMRLTHTEILDRFASRYREILLLQTDPKSQISDLILIVFRKCFSKIKLVYVHIGRYESCGFLRHRFRPLGNSLRFTRVVVTNLHLSLG